jgi:pimeloyl-ACP methyl ester carboxylesterase
MIEQAPPGAKQIAADGRPPLGQFYEVDGRQLWLHQSGTGGPAVVILPGASAVGLDYLNIGDQIGQFTTSVLYDRGGTGWSGEAPLPRAAAEVATELRDLLRAADVPGPYLLVAHSLGGGYARRFAQLFPGDVAGVLYLDSFYEHLDDYMPEKLHLDKVRQPDPGPVQLALMRPAIRRMYRRMFASWPDGLRAELIDRHLSGEWWQAGVRERSNLPAVAAELRQGGDVPDVPVIVLAPTGIDPGLRLMMPGKALKAMADGNRRMYADLAGSVTRGEYRALEGARHSTMTTDRPDAVVQAVRDLIAMAASEE